MLGHVVRCLARRVRVAGYRRSSGRARDSLRDLHSTLLGERPHPKDPTQVNSGALRMAAARLPSGVDRDERMYVELPAGERPRRGRLLEKTPRNALRIAFFSAMFPNARFVVLHRDARENIASMGEVPHLGGDLPRWGSPRASNARPSRAMFVACVGSCWCASSRAVRVVRLRRPWRLDRRHHRSHHRHRHRRHRSLALRPTRSRVDTTSTARSTLVRSIAIA